MSLHTLDRAALILSVLAVAMGLASGCGASLEVAGAFEDEDAASSTDTDPGAVDGLDDTRTSLRDDGQDTLPPSIDTAPSDTRPVPIPDTRDTASAIDTAPTPDSAACPSRRWCTFATGGQKSVGASCWLGTDCCSGECFDAKPGDGVPGACSAPGGLPSDWCGGRDGAAEWCVGAEGKVCAR